MIFEWFLVGSLWFWLILAGGFAALCYAMDDHFEHGGSLATVDILVVLAVLCLLGNFNPFPWILQHPYEIVGGLLVYLALGTGWSVLKWIVFTNKAIRRYQQVIDEFTESQIGTEGSTFSNEVERRSGFYPSQYPLAARKHKSRIMTWMVYWPVSFFWTLVSDLIHRLFEEIYELIAGLLQSISDRAYARLRIPEKSSGPKDLSRGP